MNSSQSTPATDQTLPFRVHSWSSYSATYHPENILVNKPNDQSSRWSSGSNNQNQFITLELQQMSLVSMNYSLHDNVLPDAITFGKYHKVHVCNLKEFKVFGGLTLDNMVEIMHSGLRNDSEPETFSVKNKTRNVLFPCKYIKIVPLLAHGANFNFSIWYVEFHGSSDSAYVNQVYRNFISFRETEAIRLCLKHLRQRNLTDSFNTLSQTTQINLEDPSLTTLFNTLVVNGDFDTTEQLISQAAKQNLFDEFISDCKYTPIWKRIRGFEAESPGPRGGHQMCIDSEGGKIYMLGGWSGHIDLADFWCFNLRSHTWRCISKDTSKQGGPGTRSCHKICFDPLTKSIFLLGKYVESESRPNVNLDSDFWAFDTVTEKWRLVSPNTAAEGGPELIYDHQMVIDPSTHTIYVFGGRALSPEPNTTVYSGLYSYRITENQWKLIRNDKNQAENTIQLRSRIGHSMLLNPQSRELYIFAGQRSKDYLSDFYVYNIDEDTVQEISRDYSKSGGPEAGFTQRATYDAAHNEIYVLSGLMKDKTNSNESVRSSLWVFSLNKMKWTKIYQNDNTSHEYWDQMKDIEPCPRYAHQLVYDESRRSLYLFGGNPGIQSSPRLRLDDFWELSLSRPNATAIHMKAKFEIRQQKFKEICTEAFKPNSNISKGSALEYLHHKVSEVVDHNNDEQFKQYRNLTKWLFFWEGVGIWGNTDQTGRLINVPNENSFGGLVTGDNTNQLHGLRTELYGSLLKFFPESMKEPTENLVDIVPII